MIASFEFVEGATGGVLKIPEISGNRCVGFCQNGVKTSMGSLKISTVRGG
jgi:hypothetical protein